MIFLFFFFIQTKIVYIAYLFLDIDTTEGKSLMVSILLCCAALGILDFYFSTRKLSKFLVQCERFIWPSIFSILYILAGVSLETGLGLFNELYIMLYCLFVTLTSFIFAFRKNSMSLSIISLLAGLAMPFIIEDAYETSISVLYSFVIITFATGLYLYHGWAFLLFVSSFSFWASTYIHNQLALSRQDIDLIRAAIFIQWAMFWASTTIRERFLVHLEDEKKKKKQEKQNRRRSRRLNRRNNSNSPSTDSNNDSTINNDNNDNESHEKDHQIHAFRQRKLIFLNFFILVVCTHLLVSTYYNVAHWAPWATIKGFLYLSAAFGFSIWEKKQRKRNCIQKSLENNKMDNNMNDDNNINVIVECDTINKSHSPFMSLVYPNYVVAIVLLSAAIWLGSSGDEKFVYFAIEACVIILVSNQTADWIGMTAGCLLWVYVLLWSIYVLVVTEPIFPIFNREAFLQLFIISMLALQSHKLLNDKFLYVKLTFEGIVHALLNMWLYREFATTENYLYIVTALYPAAVQFFAYFKGDSSQVVLIRMIFGDVLWLWLFISQTLPRLLFLQDQPNIFPLLNLITLIDIFVIGAAVQSALLQDQRLQGTSRWIYMVFCNATWISLIYRDAPDSLIIIFLGVYNFLLLFFGFYFKSSYLKLGGILTLSVLFIDDFVFQHNVDVLWKGTLALFAGIVAVAIVFLPQNPDECEEDPIDKRAKFLSKSGQFDIAKMTFNTPTTPETPTRPKLLRSPNRLASVRANTLTQSQYIRRIPASKSETDSGAY